ncbi:MAG: hypothetical protein ACE37N_14685 [Pseudohongiellaceae bacterium]
MPCLERHDHQTANARSLAADAGGAQLLRQSEMSEEGLLIAPAPTCNTLAPAHWPKRRSRPRARMPTQQVADEVWLG